MSNIDEMKSIINQLSDIFENTDIEINEAPLGDAVASLKNGARKAGTSAKAALGSKKAQGRQKRDQLGKKMLDGWYHWIGLTGKEGNAEDLESFLVSKVGFSRPEADQLMDQVSNNILGNDRDVDTTDSSRNDRSDSDSEQETTNTSQAPDNQDSPQPSNPDASTSSSEETDSNSTETNTNDNSQSTSTANDNEQNSSSRTANDNVQRTSNTANDNNSSRTANDDEPNDNIPEDTNVSKMVNNIEDLMNYNNHRGVKATMNLRDIMKNCTDLLPYIGRQNKNNISPQQRLQTAEAILDGIDFVSSNDRSGVFDPYSIAERRQKLVTLIQELKNQLNSTNESINEVLDDGETISRADLIKFFDAAAAYAYEHNLVGKRRKKDGYGVPVDGVQPSVQQGQGGTSGNGVGGRNYVPQSEDEKDEKRFNRRLDNVWDKVETLGLDSEDIQDAKRLANKNKYEDISKPEDKNALSAIGWAFLKSLK